MSPKMSAKYRYGHRSPKKHHFLMFVVPACLVLAAAGYFIVKDLQKSQSPTVEGTARVVGQITGQDAHKLAIDEPLFTMQLPSDWKEVERINKQHEQSITWRATKKNQDNRTLKIYIDTIPTTLAINRLLPVVAQGDSLTAGDVSDNCATFTGTGDRSQARSTSSGRWAGVDFICNIAGFVDNQVGAGAAGSINQVTVTGAKGPHKYFFLFTDRNVQPDYSIFQNALQSFRAK